MDTLLTGATVVTMDEAMRVLPNGYVGVAGGKISYLGETPPPETERPKEIIDATGMVLMPGLINCHTHLPMTILRGAADDYELQTWLNKHIFPREDRLDGRTVKAATLLGIAECLQFGVTSFSDMYYFIDEMAQAAAESGIKASLARGTTMFEGDAFDFEKFPACRELVEMHEKWHNYDNGRIHIEASVHAEYTSTHQLWDALSEFCINEGLRMHVHLSETKREHEACVEKYGLTPAQILDCHHVFDVPALAAHCVWLTGEDMGLLARRGVSAVHNPISNLKLASGVADVQAMVRAGMNVALGTDGVASNNNMDLFEEIKAAALLAKVKNNDPTAVPAAAALLMATACGARAQGREKECGMLKEGYDADLILVDFTRPHLLPCHNVLSSLAYSARGGDVALTMVRGKVLYAGGEFKTIDMAAVVRELTGYGIPRVFGPDAKE